MEKQNKKCRVCGDVALSFNYNGLCCYSCKMFFRRNALDYEKFKCQYDGKCDIDKASRKYCQRCRLDKCFQIGMKKEMIEIDQTKVVRPAAAIEQASTSAQANSNYLLRLPQSVTRNYFELDRTEMKYIEELNKFTKKIFNFDVHKLPILYEETNPIRAFKLGSVNEFRVVKYCKSNSTYSSLEYLDQMEVLKQFMYHCILIRSTISYDWKRNAILFSADEQGTSAVLTKMKVFDNFNSNENQTTCRSLSKEMEQDEVIQNLLMAQALYLPRNNLSNSESMRYEYWIYHRVLLYYLQWKYRNLAKAEEKYLTLINLVNDFPNGFEYCRQFVANHQKDFADNVILEVFDVHDGNNTNSTG